MYSHTSDLVHDKRGFIFVLPLESKFFSIKDEFFRLTVWSALMPEAIRKLFRERKWETIVAYQTRSDVWEYIEKKQSDL